MLQWSLNIQWSAGIGTRTIGWSSVYSTGRSDKKASMIKSDVILQFWVSNLWQMHHFHHEQINHLPAHILIWLTLAPVLASWCNGTAVLEIMPCESWGCCDHHLHQHHAGLAPVHAATGTMQLWSPWGTGHPASATSKRWGWWEGPAQAGCSGAIQRQVWWTAALCPAHAKVSQWTEGTASDLHHQPSGSPKVSAGALERPLACLE